MPQNAHDPDPLHTFDAGVFSAWLVSAQAAIRGDESADVPCGDCTACCTSSQFIHIGPDEVETLARIPKALRFPAPKRPRGHVVLGFDERGHCPMLRDGACTIYEHRPRTCRTYDCRVFTATGLEPATHQVEIRRQVRRWVFTYPTPQDERLRRAVVRAAEDLVCPVDDGAVLGRPSGADSLQPTQRAALAVEQHAHFLVADD